MGALASAQAEAFVERPTTQVLDYMEHTLAGKMGTDLSVDRTEMNASAALFPGSTISQNGDGTRVIQMSGNRLVMWALAITFTPVGEGTKVVASLTQINDSFLQRKTARPKLEGYLVQLISTIRADLAK